MVEIYVHLSCDYDDDTSLNHHTQIGVGVRRSKGGDLSTAFDPIPRWGLYTSTSAHRMKVALKLQMNI